MDFPFYASKGKELLGVYSQPYKGKEDLQLVLEGPMIPYLLFTRHSGNLRHHLYFRRKERQGGIIGRFPLRKSSYVNLLYSSTKGSHYFEMEFQLQSNYERLILLYSVEDQ